MSPNMAAESTIAVSAMPVENQAMLTSMSLRRPMTSERVPAVRAPTRTPMRA